MVDVMVYSTLLEKDNQFTDFQQRVFSNCVEMLKNSNKSVEDGVAASEIYTLLTLSTDVSLKNILKNSSPDAISRVKRIFHDLIFKVTGIVGDDKKPKERRQIDWVKRTQEMRMFDIDWEPPIECVDPNLNMKPLSEYDCDIDSISMLLCIKSEAMIGIWKYFSCFSNEKRKAVINFFLNTYTTKQIFLVLANEGHAEKKFREISELLEEKENEENRSKALEEKQFLDPTSKMFMQMFQEPFQHVIHLLVNHIKRDVSAPSLYAQSLIQAISGCVVPQNGEDMAKYYPKDQHQELSIVICSMIYICNNCIHGVRPTDGRISAVFHMLKGGNPDREQKRDYQLMPMLLVRHNRTEIEANQPVMNRGAENMARRGRGGAGRQAGWGYDARYEHPPFPRNEWGPYRGGYGYGGAEDPKRRRF